ncbi:dnaJ-like protein 60 isoform X2 [Anthonomus grandis grandis]|uniref:dnaJ-like protein 60 isoform X2 n=1 Tax=Anthonomus grandis grandis TaxID=2921223 RepID=UPI0021666DB4|nr:dnaJ-like protein 60 isoform X2 [Anthonomus grandis grandis]
MNQNSSCPLLRHITINLRNLFHTTRTRLDNHYETLKLKSNCTGKEIRESFLKLSKEYHPDINKHPSAHKEFLKIQEAYNILSKPNSRANYDLGLNNPFQSKYESTGTTYTYQRPSTGPHQYRSGPYKTYTRNPWDDPSFYSNKSYSYSSDNDSYYGIKGIKRQSNGTVLFVVLIFGLVAFVLEMLAFRDLRWEYESNKARELNNARYTYSKQQEIMNQRTMATQRILNEIKERAEKNGKEAQIEIHKKQFEEIERNSRSRALRRE